MNDDLKRDLDLVTSSSLDLASKQSASAFPLTEIATSSAPVSAPALRKGAGPKAVRSKAPTVKAAPEASVAVDAPEPTVEVMAQAPSPTTEQTPDPAAPAVPRPSPMPTIPTGGEGVHGHDGGGPNPGAGDGGGSILGGIFGTIIRGGVVDGDHCDPRTDGRRRRPYPRDGGVFGRGGGGIPGSIGLPPIGTRPRY
jgi:hypothetical protein